MKEFQGKPFEILGEWQLDHDKERCYVGTLKYSAGGGLTLRLVNAVDREQSFHRVLGGTAVPTRISAVGHTHTFGRFSLFDGFETTSGYSSHGPVETEYFFNRGLLGVAVENAGEQSFSSIYATGDLLRQWLDQKMVRFDGMENFDKEIKLCHTTPDPIDVPIGSEKKLRFMWDRDGPAVSVAQSNVVITSRPWVGFDFGTPQGIGSALRDIDVAQRLISLLSGFELWPSLIELELSENDTARKSTERAVFLSQRQRPEDPSLDLTPMDMLFTFPRIQPRFQELAMKWCELHAEIPGCLNVFFSADYSRYTNQRLFALTSALEALHRHLTAEKKVTLRRRILESGEKLPGLITEVVGDVNAFARRVVEHRNMEAHCAEEGARGSGSLHHRLAWKVRAMMDALILQELGLPLSEIISAMKGSRRYWFYASNETWPWESGE